MRLVALSLTPRSAEPLGDAPARWQASMRIFDLAVHRIPTFDISYAVLKHRVCNLH
jgi:hypothetical protein